MQVEVIRPGLWRWTAPHPEWSPEKDKPGGWKQMVGCVYYEPPRALGDAVVLFDPLAPPAGTPEAKRFWDALDRDVRRVDRPVAVLLGTYFHERSAQAIHDRYGARPGASIHLPEDALGRVQCAPTRPFRTGDPLPGGVQAHPIRGLQVSETVYYLPPHRALVFSDSLIGVDGGRVRVPPARWAPETPEGAAGYRAEFRASLRTLLDLPVEILLVSHGDPILENGRDALAEALDAPAWGEG
jgi:hypothetical protein